MDMRGMAATVTSCIGGKNEKFAVKVQTEKEPSVYFVYKTMEEFDALWGSLETLAHDVKQDKNKPKVKKPSVLATWLSSVVDNYAFRQIIRDLRAQEKETMTTLNVLLQFLVARVQPQAPQLPVKKSNKNGRKRSFEEMRPEDGEAQRSSLFPIRSGTERVVKSQKVCGMREWRLPQAGKMAMVAPVASRRRVFAQVEF
ncbi:hypothetical protein BBO99_00004761 [Phytophthora kernoviae]|uniref:Uncharacterized protein n=2 Tax=Phytophthora kernoviae TaxID=325452 RepID=A0A3R7MMM5_9STRA|nr:hypothetical protein G195_009852 [Phytophthora kernoviae 00238/432]KAG2515427.1 hypothetical protein JM18_008165 [Phytophthora kernoviae]KAG2522786.1 hypothetical protein JM16_004474 [Phytophthora kernoviae]RLN10893.1 hypothetical protein BBI17_004860 [Phytophthora kernoviae]RLN80081.1 hypothetical protein BBO99_00004761 [Phytophthora kernoviae]